MSKVWFITGVGRRGLALNIAKADLPAENAVIAIGITKEAHL
jgi:hypothetical protein